MQNVGNVDSSCEKLAFHAGGKTRYKKEDNMILVTHFDADWGGQVPMDRKSASAIVRTLYNKVISFKSKKKGYITVSEV